MMLIFVLSRSHATHHLLAIYALGADARVLHGAYQTHVLYQRPSFPSPGEITASNWKEHLGDEKSVICRLFHCIMLIC